MLLLYASGAIAQVEWKYAAKKIGDRLYELRVTALIDQPWKIYSQRTPEGGPLPTTIKFSSNPLIQIDGKMKELGDMKIYHEEVFGVDVYAYEEKVEFVQVIKLKNNAKTNIKGSIEYMACTSEQCLPPASFSFSVSLE